MFVSIFFSLFFYIKSKGKGKRGFV